MKIVVRVDASDKIGSGHLMRCKSLSDELRQRGNEVRFVCRALNGNLAELLRNAGYTVTLLPWIGGIKRPQQAAYAEWLGVTQVEDADETKLAITDFMPDWLIVDHYGIDATWERMLRPSVRHICAIDDLANRQHDCDILLDQNWFGLPTPNRYDHFLPQSCRKLLGPTYALLQPVFRQLRNNNTPRLGALQRILIFFGAVDSHGQTITALRALCSPNLSHIPVDVVIGSANSCATEILQLASTRSVETIVYQNLSSLANLMARADLMLGAGGTTTWERCCLGLPSIVVAASENQLASTRALGNEGVHMYIGCAATVSEQDWITEILNLMNSSEMLRTSGVRAAGIIDGLGAPRVASIITRQLTDINIRCAIQNDESILLKWANDPVVRKNAFSGGTISPQGHNNWFKSKLGDDACMLLIGEDDYGMPVGQVRFDIRNRTGFIDISVDSDFRGQGVGKRLLHAAIKALQQERSADAVVGEVISTNEPSCQMFIDLGFNDDLGQDGSRRFVLSLNSLNVTV
jgi:UDP-2,4-diacetamido-2,4,6-trideoxy-beta-L-altropyranose hydrolase